MTKKTVITLFLGLICSGSVYAQQLSNPVDLSGHWAGYLSLLVFLLSYFAVVTEEFTQLRKSKPVLFAAGVIWIVIGWFYTQADLSSVAEHALKEHLLAYAELMLFMLVTLTYINALEERQVFAALRVWLINRHLSYRQMFWITGAIAFFMSPWADNLITALLIGAVVCAIGHGNRLFISLGLINVVVAANAGGVFSPFGDLTTLMVWQSGKVEFWEFLELFVPAAVAYLVPAVMLFTRVPRGRPDDDQQSIVPGRGALRIFLLFMLTIFTTISFNYYLHLPSVIGMLTGLAYLQFFGFYLKKTAHHDAEFYKSNGNGEVAMFDIFTVVSRVEWDTILFFYGVIMCVGGLGFLGYLALLSDSLYGGLGVTGANVMLGIMSAFLDSIPVMYGVLVMDPQMSHQQWLLVTMTTGLGGSLLAIGSAGGVALMGQARNVYTFFVHLKWLPAILTGYLAAVLVFMLQHPESFPGYFQ